MAEATTRRYQYDDRQLAGRAGRLGARARWGPPRVVRLDDLSPEQRRLVLALVDAARAGQAAKDGSK
jgi:hypothetical protein